MVPALALCPPSCLVALEPSGSPEDEDKVHTLKVAESQTRGLIPWHGTQIKLPANKEDEALWSRHCARFLFPAAVGKGCGKGRNRS